MFKVQSVFLLSIALLVSLGLVMVFDTTAAEAIDHLQTGGTHYSLIKQIAYVILGGLVGWGLFCLGYESLLALSGYFLQFFTLLLILVFIPGIGQQINGAHRWLSIFGHSFQPSECVKYLIPLYYIQRVTLYNRPLVLKEFLIILFQISIPMGLILIEPDNGTVAILFSVLVVLFIMTRVRWIYFALPLVVLALIGGAIASRMPHVGDRLRIYLHPELDLKGKGHQPYQAKIAAGSGGLLGKGVGKSLQKLSYLPEARSDYIAAIFAEEWGFCGIIGLIVLYMMVGWLGFKMAVTATNRARCFVIAIFTYLICFQAFLNLGVVSGFLPSKGTNLPFFSQGGSSMLANCMAVAVILSASRRKISTRGYEEGMI